MLKNIKFACVFICLVCALFSTNSFVFAQDKEQVCEPKFRHNMFAVDFVNAKTGWACGEAGVIYHTVDGGFNWDLQRIDTQEALFAISFANTEVGWVVGNKGLIFHTTDGGKTWNSQKDPKIKILFNLQALSADKAIACGDFGTIVYTSDGGKTWEDRTYSKDMEMYGINFVDENEGWIAGEFGTILHTTDSGATWEVQPSGSQATLFCISFGTKLEGLATGMDGLIVKTVDGGNTWKKVEIMIAQDKAIKAMEKTDQGNVYRQEGYIKEMTQKSSIFEVGLLGNVAVAAGDEGVLLTSSDAGDTWERVSLPPDLSLLWFRGISLVKNEDKIMGVTIGAKAVCIINENQSLTAVGFLPEVTVCQKQ